MLEVFALIASLAQPALPTFKPQPLVPEVAGRKGSKRVGGRNSSGKGSRYVGGRKR